MSERRAYENSADLTFRDVLYLSGIISALITAVGYGSHLYRKAQRKETLSHLKPLVEFDDGKEGLSHSDVNAFSRCANVASTEAINIDFNNYTNKKLAEMLKSYQQRGNPQ